MWDEKVLEDYAVENWQDIFRCVSSIGGVEHECTVIGRQIPCRHGIIDLLAYSRYSLFVVEFKSVLADDKVVGQLQRYKRAIENLPLPKFVTLDMIPVVESLRVVQTIVVAPSFTKRALWGADFCIEAKRFVDGHFEFRPAEYQSGNRRADEQLRDSLTPYFANLLAIESEHIKRNSEGILRHSAGQRMGEVN